MIIPDNKQRPHVIKRKDVNKGVKGLGVYLAPSGKNKTQMDVMEKYSKKWASDMKSNVVSRYSASVALNTTVTKAHQYRVPATTFTETECDKIMTPVYSTILPKMGITRTIPLPYRYGPVELQGFGFTNLHTLQGIEQIKILLMHGGQDTQNGRYLTCMIEAHQLECGSVLPFFSLDYNEYEDLVTDC